MASPLGADDWIVPDQASAPARAPATGGDDWFVPEEKPTFTQKVENADKSITPAPMARVETAVGQGMVEGFGNEPLGIAPGSDTEKGLQKTGLLHTPGQSFNPAQAVTDFGIRAAADAGDSFFRAIGAVTQGVATGAGQVAREFGQSDVEAGKLTRDVGTMEDMALMAPNPEIGLMEGAAPRLSTPEEIAAFNAKASATAPAPFSQTRADIDEFLRQRAARETQSQATQQLLSPPSEDRAAPATAAPQAGAPPPEAPVAPAAATGPLDTDFSTYEEPGRAAPPAGPDDWTVPAEPVAAAPEAAAPVAQIPEKSEEKPPEPPNRGPATLQALLQDPRSAEEIRTDMAAGRGHEDAVAAHGADEAQNATVAPIYASGPTFDATNPPVYATEAAGTLQSPVDLIATPDVYAGAEQTGVPTPGQAEAGNYKKRHVKWNGLNIAIETEAGQVRPGRDVPLTSPYGYVKRTTGADNENIDVYLGPEPQSPHVYIVDQIDPETGAFDEHKALIGYPDEASARGAYVAGFSDGSGNGRLGAIRPLTVDEFKTWLKGSPRNPLAYSDPVAAASDAAAAIPGLNPTEDALDAAGHTIKVSGTDPTEAIVTATEQHALVDLDVAVQNAKDEGIGDGWTSIPAAESATGEGIAPAGERPAEAESEVPAAAPPARVEPHGAEPSRGESGPVEPGSGAENWWDHELTTAGRADFLKLVGLKKPARVKWRYLDIHERAKLLHLREQPAAPAGEPVEHPGLVIQSLETGKRTEVQPPGTRKPSDWTEIGKNETGQTLYEDQRGVRSYIENGVRITEPVPIRPTRAGVVPEKPIHKDEWQLASEKSAPVTRDEAPAAPKIAPISLTTKDLKSLAANVVKMTDDGRVRTREQIAEFMQHMAEQGKKIAEHCIETGGKFSVRS